MHNMSQNANAPLDNRCSSSRAEMPTVTGDTDQSSPAFSSPPPCPADDHIPHEVRNPIPSPTDDTLVKSEARAVAIWQHMRALAR